MLNQDREVVRMELGFNYGTGNTKERNLVGRFIVVDRGRIVVRSRVSSETFSTEGPSGT